MVRPLTFEPWEDNYIRAHYPHENTREIAEHLGRKPQRIRTRAHEIGVAKAPGQRRHHQDRARARCLEQRNGPLRHHESARQVR